MKFSNKIICLFVAAFSAFSSLFVFPVVAADESYYVTIYDESNKKIVKVAKNSTVKEVLKEINISLEKNDIVEPSLTSIVNINNFFINIHRSRPVLITDGIERHYIETASYDERNIANEAGFTVFDGDEITLVKNPAFLSVGAASTYEIHHHGGTTLTITEEIPFTEEVIKDYTMAPGTSSVDQIGELGSKTIVYNVLSINGEEVSREIISESVTKNPVPRIIRVGASLIQRKPLTAKMGRNRYTITKSDGTIIERQETYYDLPMGGVMKFCGKTSYTVRADGVKIDDEGYILVAADLNRYPRCSIVETSLGLGKVYDTGGFALTNPEQFDIATDWTNRNGI